jgi:hypothetical protein
MRSRKGRDFCGQTTASKIRTNPQNGLVARATKHLVANQVEANANAA